MSDQSSSSDEEQRKRRLMIEVLDKGLLGLSEAGTLARLLEAETQGDVDGRCNCRQVCGGCDGRCNCPPAA